MAALWSAYSARRTSHLQIKKSLHSEENNAETNRMGKRMSQEVHRQKELKNTFQMIYQDLGLQEMITTPEERSTKKEMEVFTQRKI